jgi:diamine N-acetyltransferase
MGDMPEAPGLEATITLREITKETVNDILRLKVADNQTRFVSTNAVSIAQAYFEPKVWFRAVYADETPVGFIMLYDDPDTPEYHLFRFMIDAAHQGKGYGKQAILRLVEHVRTRPGARELVVSYMLGEGSPEWFYRKLGFVPTGEEEEGEFIARLPLTDAIFEGQPEATSPGEHNEIAAPVRGDLAASPRSF